MKKNGEWVLRDQVWMRNGVHYPNVARIKSDRVLRCTDVRNYFLPGTFVHYCTNLVYREEFAKGEVLYLASVKEVDGNNSCPIPLGMLEFTPRQRRELLAEGIPPEAFKKLPSRVFPSDLEEPYGLDLEGVYDFWEY